MFKQKLVEVEDGVFEYRDVKKRNARARAAKARWQREGKEKRKMEKEQEKIQQAELRKQRTSKARAASGTMKHYKDKDTSTQMELLVTQMLTQFIKELRGRPLVEYDVQDKDSRTVRKEQLGIINSTIQTIRQMRELSALLADEEAEGAAGNVKTPENVTMLDDARKLLKRVGVKADL